jgi:hypothetical protein
MNDIAINRDILRRLLDKHFELTAESGARINVLNRNRDKNLQAAQNFVSALLKETEAQRAQTQSFETHLKEALVREDDDSFRQALSHLFPPR